MTLADLVIASQDFLKILSPSSVLKKIQVEMLDLFAIWLERLSNGFKHPGYFVLSKDPRMLACIVVHYYRKIVLWHDNVTTGASYPHWNCNICSVYQTSIAAGVFKFWAFPARWQTVSISPEFFLIHYLGLVFSENPVGDLPVQCHFS